MMTLEIVFALVLAAGTLWLVLAPLVRPQSVGPEVYEPPDPSSTRKGLALAALREIEFDRATGKLSDADYQQLHTRYQAEAIEAMREADATPAGPVAGIPDVEALVAAEVQALKAGEADGDAQPACDRCGPRPEADAVFCSDCGRLLSRPARCGECSMPLEPGAHFCSRCGAALDSPEPATS